MHYKTAVNKNWFIIVMILIIICVITFIIQTLLNHQIR